MFKIIKIGRNKMKEEIWDGEMDYGWEDLAEKVRIVSNNFADVMLETVSFSPIKEAVDLISKESLQRLCLLADQLASQIKDGYYYQTEDAENNIQNASKLTSWIILGSLTETVLQMFLAFYIEDYKKTQWQQWVDFPAATVKERINVTISQLVEDGVIESNQGKSLKEAIKDNIKRHCVEHPVQRVMLDEIIQFYIAQELLDEDEIQYLRIIQSNRNGIHSFESRTIGTWSDLQYATRFWCYLLEEKELDVDGAYALIQPEILKNMIGYMCRDIHKVGVLKTYRDVCTKFQNVEICLDMNEYLSIVDYELEIEYTSENGADSMLRQMVKKFGLQLEKKTEGKNSRFFHELKHFC